MSDQMQRIKVLSAGTLSLVLMLGIDWLANTSLLSLMQQQTERGISEGG